MQLAAIVECRPNAYQKELVTSGSSALIVFNSSISCGNSETLDQSVTLEQHVNSSNERIRKCKQKPRQPVTSLSHYHVGDHWPVMRYVDIETCGV